MVERPDWSAVTSLMADLKKSMRGVNDAQRKMEQITGVAWSDDREIKVMVGPRGQLVDLEIDPRVFRKPNSKALAATILATARRAAEDAARQSKEILDSQIPFDMRNMQVNGMDVGTMLTTPDVDLVKKNGREEEVTDNG